jgi:hypothetical protein
VESEYFCNLLNETPAWNILSFSNLKGIIAIDRVELPQDDFASLHTIGAIAVPDLPARLANTITVLNPSIADLMTLADASASERSL